MNKILFVDDEMKVLDGLRRLLFSKRKEWQCYFVQSVDAAFEILNREDIDAIVSDVSMPVKSGLDLLKRVRSEDKTRYLPVLMLTGNGDVGTKQAALALGATDFLNKPFDFIELTARLQNAITIKEYQDEIHCQNERLEEKVRERTKAVEQSRKDMLLRLARAAETRDSDTGNHIVRVGLTSQIIARALGFDHDWQGRMLLTAPLHDVGKIGISDDILRKPGALTEDERRRMQEHCKIGSDILTQDHSEYIQLLSGSLQEKEENELLKLAARIALCHHERWDGTGYPNGIKGRLIPIEARIVAIADVYDALRTARPYKEAFSPEKTLKIMLEGSGTQFDPQILSVFASIFDDVEETLKGLRVPQPAFAVAA